MFLVQLPFEARGSNAGILVTILEKFCTCIYIYIYVPSTHAYTHVLHLSRIIEAPFLGSGCGRVV